MFMSTDHLKGIGKADTLSASVYITFANTCS